MEKMLSPRPLQAIVRMARGVMRRPLVAKDVRLGLLHPH